MRARIRPLRAACALAMVTWTTACFSYQPVGKLPDSGRLPAEIRLTRYDNTVVVLADSRIEADTIRGYQPGIPGVTTVPLAHVDLIEAKQLRKKDSLLAAAAALAVFAFVAWVVGQQSPIEPPESIP